MSRLTVSLLAAVVVALFVVVAGLLFIDNALDRPLQVSDDVIEFQIDPGTPFAAVARRLGEQGVVEHPRLLRWYARFTGAAHAIKAGEYQIESGDTPRGLLSRFVEGDVMLYSFTIIEGWNYRELLAAIKSSEVVESTITDEDLPAVLQSFGADYTHPEGLFLPETYRIPRGTTDVELLRQAFEHLQATLAEEWGAREENLPVSSPYEALILASIIEKETALAQERPEIAGVFVRRLQSRMRLQTDPTVIYGIGPDFNGNITRRDLRTDTPYNTYTRHGLPPTPIAMPGRAAIHAALHPAEGSALYFVATGLGDGSHKFSDTKDEHDAAVQEYLRRLRNNRN